MKTFLRVLTAILATEFALDALLVQAAEKSPEAQPRGSGGIFEAFKKKSPASGEDPFKAGRNGAEPTAEPVSSTPAPGGVAPVPQRSSTTNLPPKEARQRANAALVAARRMLAAGQLEQAKAKIAEARQQGANYQVNEDAPSRVDQLVTRIEALQRQQQQEGDTEQVRQAGLKLQLEQAEALLWWRDYETAHSLAASAQQLAQALNIPDEQASGLLQRIAVARQGTAPVAQSPTAQSPRRAEAIPSTIPAAASTDNARASYDAPLNNEAPDSQQIGLSEEATAGPLVARAPQSAKSLLEQTVSSMTVEERKLMTDIADKQVEARRVLQAEPLRARQLVKDAQLLLDASTVSNEMKQRQTTQLSRTMADVEKHIQENRARLELDERNKTVLDELDREREHKVQVQQQLAKLVEEYNRLQDERRFSEAEQVAKRAAALAPREPVAIQLVTASKMIRNLNRSKEIRDAKADMFVANMDNVEESSIAPAGDYVFPEAKKWQDMTARRRTGDSSRKKTAKEIEIEQKLKSPVSVEFHNQPLSVVIETLGEITKVNVHIDDAGLSEESVTTDVPVTIVLKEAVSFRSALNLILEPLNLAYMITDEVLLITSKQMRNGEVYPVTYNVADLVIPIPNFVPGGRMGMGGALRDAYATVGYGGAAGGVGSQAPLSVVATRDGGDSSAANPSMLAQMAGMTPPTGEQSPTPGGPGGMGGAPRPDFETLINLITSTVAPQSWDEVGGPGTIERFPLNLSLVISQTQDVHEQIVDLLNQLRRLQDLQVAIEVKFITLSDNFFERIGISLDFNINSRVDRPFQIFGRSDETIPTAFQDAPFNVNQGVQRDVIDRNLTRGNSVIAGLTLPNVFSADLDIPVTTGGSFTSAVPQFGGFDAATAASTGFAILSDIETYFFMTAAQGDRRSNVLQAPKVTLFNGQAAVVSDQSFSPFVISVIPVVGDFAAAQQPVIMILPEGTNLTVQAVVSSDRRFVRLTVVPYFSNIEKVDTFRFTGSTRTRVDTSNEGPDDNPAGRARGAEVVAEGTTVQLPTLAVVTVTTTVSVPDGGTVLLGGVKRLREGRNEFGVPFLNKIPYVKRLFSNVGIGRETSSLMLMVTPRIIIQEEEESLLGITPQQP